MRTRRLADAGVTLRKALAFEAIEVKRGERGGGDERGVGKEVESQSEEHMTD